MRIMVFFFLVKKLEDNVGDLIEYSWHLYSLSLYGDIFLGMEMCPRK